MRRNFAAHWLSMCLLPLVGKVLAFEVANYTTVPTCAYDCVISAFETPGVASCSSALDTNCTCVDEPYQDWLYTCVTSNCTVKEQLMAKKISSVQCGVPLLPVNVGVLVAMYTLFAVATALTVVRVMVKLMGHGGGWGLDDWLMVPAFACLVTIIGISVSMLEVAFGHNVWDVPFDHISLGLQLFWVADQFYTALISITKLSMCFFFLRIFGHSRSFRHSVYAVIAANVVVGLVFQFMVAFQCRPVPAFWTSWTGEIGEYYCFELYSFALGQAVVSIVMDAVMFALPIRETLKVKLTPKKKIGVIIMFAMGFIWTIVGIVRAIVLWDTRQRPGELYNVTVSMSPLGYWTVFEASIAVMCACLPDSRFFFSRLVPKTFGWNSTKDSSPKSPYQLTDLSARSARQRKFREAAGMITVTTEFDLKSAACPGPESVEHLTTASVPPEWGRVDEGDKGLSSVAAEDEGWPLQLRPCMPK